MGLPAPALAATNSAVPKSGTWGAWKGCPSKFAGGNCASVYASGENPKTHTLFVGGSFSAAVNSATGSRVGYQNLMAVSSTSGALRTGFARHTFNGTIFAVAVDTARNRVYVGGSFTKVDGSGTGAKHVAAFSMSSGARIRSFSAAANGPVYALAYSGSTDLLYLGGRFSAVNGHQRSRLAGVSPVNGGVSSRFTPPTVSWTESHSVSDVRSLAVGVNGSGSGMLYVGGHFDHVGGSAQLSLMRVRLSSGAFDGGFRPSLEHSNADPLMSILAIHTVSGGIIVGQAGHVNRALRFNLSGAQVWRLKTDGDVQAVAVHGASVYVGGHFRCVDRSHEPVCGPNGSAWTRVHLAAVNPSTGAVDPGFSPRMEPNFAPYFFGVWMLRVSASGVLWVGGESTKVVSGGHSYSRPKLAAFPGR
jgi:hypothetical protein